MPLILFLIALLLLLALAGDFAPRRNDRRAGQTRLALLADLHLGPDDPVAAGYYRSNLIQVIDQVNRAEVDGVLIAGDLTQDGLPHQWAEFQRLRESFHAPSLIVPGNHDVGNKAVPGSPDPVTPERIAHWEAIAGLSFWKEELPDLTIIGLNGSILGSNLCRESEQWAFLEHHLESRISPTVLLIHFPLFLADPEEPADLYWNVEPAPRRRLLALAGEAGVRAVLSGHIHRPLHHRFAGLDHVTAPPISFGLPPGDQPEGWSLLTLDPAGNLGVGYHYLVD